MNRMDAKSMNDEKILEWLHQWIGCDEQAGQRFWGHTGFYLQYKERAMIIGRKYLRSYPHGSDIWRFFNAGEMEDCALEVLQNVILRLKKKIKKGGDLYSFPDVPSFHGFLNQSLKGMADCIRKKIQERFQIISFNKQLSQQKGEKDEGGPITLADRLHDSELSPEEQRIRAEMLERVATLLNRFREGLTNSIRHHFDFCRETQGSGENQVSVDEVWGLLIFVQAPKGTHFPEIQSTLVQTRGYTQSKFNTYNRRLKNEWWRYYDKVLDDEDRGVIKEVLLW